MSSFNPETFLDASVSEPTEKRKPLPTENPEDPNGLYTALIVEVKAPTQFAGKQDASKTYTKSDVHIDVFVPPSVQHSEKLPEKLRFVPSMFIDLTEDGRGLDNSPGKNRDIRNYREALDLNKPGDTFSFRKMFGQPLKVKIAHEIYEGELRDKIGGVFRA